MREKEREREKNWADHIFGKALGQHYSVAVLDEVSHRESVFVRVTAGESLVCHVEERVMLLLFDNVGDLSPLLLGRVNAGGIVSASMQQDDGLVRRSFEIVDHPVKVQANGFLVVVSVLFHLKSRVLEDGVVVGPAGVGDVDFLSMRVEAFEEGAADSKCAGAGDGLCDGHPVFFYWCRVGSIGKNCSSFGECRDASDASIFFVGFGRNDFLLRSADRWQHIRLALVITCSQLDAHYAIHIETSKKLSHGKLPRPD